MLPAHALFQPPAASRNTADQLIIIGVATKRQGRGPRMLDDDRRHAAAVDAAGASISQ